MDLKRDTKEKMSYSQNILFCSLKRSTEVKLKKMSYEQHFTKFIASNDYSENVKDKALETLKREYDGKIAEKIKKMRSIQEEINKSQAKITNNTHKHETPTATKSNHRISYDRSLGQSDQIKFMKKQETTKDKSPVAISPERDQYGKRKEVDNRKNNDETYLKKPEESTFTVVRDIGTNTYNFDARKYVMLEFIESNNLTFEMLIDVLKKKNTADQSTNTENLAEIQNIQDNDDGVSNASDESSDALQISDINNNDDMISTQTSNEENILNENKIEENGIVDDNLIKACVSQSEQNKFILNTFCNRLADMANETSWTRSITDQFIATNITQMANKDENAMKMKVENGTSKNIPETSNKNGKEEHSHTIQKDVKKIDSPTIKILENIKVTQNIKATDIQKNVTNIPKYCTKDVAVQNANNVPKETHITTNMSTSAGGKVIMKNTPIVTTCNKEINVKNLDSSVGSVNLSSKELKQIDTNGKSPQEMLNNDCVKKLLVNLLDHLPEGAKNKKDTNSMSKYTQTRNEVIQQMPTQLNVGATISQTNSSIKTATQMIPLPPDANTLPDLLPSQQYSRLNAALQATQKNHKTSELQICSSAKTSTKNQKTQIDSLEQTVNRHPTVNQSNPVAQNIPRPNGPPDPRYHQHMQQYQQMMSPEHYYGMQTATQTVTSEMLTKRAIQVN